MLAPELGVTGALLRKHSQEVKRWASLGGEGDMGLGGLLLSDGWRVQGGILLLIYPGS